MSATIYLDESGYTGPNLTNREQPFFVLASVNFTESEASELRDEFFAGVKTKELKHKSLSANAKQHNMVLAYLEYLGHNPDRFKLYAVDKEFAAVTKVIDYFVESAAHAVGEDIYSNGHAFAMANMLYYSLRAGETCLYCHGILSRFEGLLRDPSMIRYNDFFDYVERPVANRELDAALGWIRASRELIEPDSILAGGPAGLDIIFTTALNLMSRWRTQLGQDFYVVHDYSSPMVAEQALWEALPSVDVPPESIGFVPKSMQFPIGVLSTTFGNSQEFIGLQLADVLAGAVAKSLAVKMQDGNDRYIDLIGDQAIGLSAATIMPGKPEDWPESSTSITSPDYALEFIGKYNPKTRAGM